MIITGWGATGVIGVWPMDGINPTLALAALFFGMSGAHHGTPSAERAVFSTVDCPAMMLSSSVQASPGPDAWSQAFEIDAPDANTATRPDPIIRRTVSVAETWPTAEPEAEP